MKFFFFVVFSLLALPVLSEESPEKITVGVTDIPPMVSAQNGNFTGFEIELMKEAAREAGLQVDFKLYTNVQEKLEAVQSGEVDAAIGAISVTNDRSKNLDWSVPIYNSGFQAVSIADTSLIPKFPEGFGRLVFWFLIISFVIVHIIFFSEKGSDEDIANTYNPGIFHASWVYFMLITTIGFGDKKLATGIGKLVAVPCALVGMFVYATVIGVIAVDLFNTEAKNSISDVSDFNGYTVATKVDTKSEKFLEDLGVKTVALVNLDECFEKLDNNEVDLVLYDRPMTVSALKKHGDMIETGPVFEPHHYSVALPENSKYRKSLNSAILKIQEDGRREKIFNRYF